MRNDNGRRKSFSCGVVNCGTLTEQQVIMHPVSKNPALGQDRERVKLVPAIGLLQVDAQAYPKAPGLFFRGQRA